jgi:hemoglobin
VHENFTGQKAEDVNWRAARMAEMFQYKIEYYRNNPAKPIL